MFELEVEALMMVVASFGSLRPRLTNAKNREGSLSIRFGEKLPKGFLSGR